LQTCSEVAFKDKSGAVAAYSQVFGTARTIRQAYSEGQRKEIARTRKLGACERCKRFKMKVRYVFSFVHGMREIVLHANSLEAHSIQHDYLMVIRSTGKLQHFITD
jgi:hypothetical protein